MPAFTQLLIRFHLGADQSIGEALEGLPHYSRESFVEDPPQCWRGDFVISCPVAPELAEGDFIEDFAPHFRALLTLKSLYDAEFELQIAVGPPGPLSFHLPSHMVALTAALGASLRICSNSPPTPASV